MCFGQAHFPWQASVFDRCRRACTRPAVMARNQDHIRFGLGHTRRDRPDTGGGDKLDRHFAARVDLLEIIDELRKILD